MRVLFIGDVVGRPGLEFTEKVLARRLQDWRPDLVVANGENASASGRGLSPRVAEQLYEAGVELLTLGNHAWDQRELVEYIDTDARIVRPANFPPGTPGRGYTVCPVNGKSVLIINVMGRTFLSQLDCPFRAVDEILDGHRDVQHVIVDMHAETTSEKLAMGWHLDGRVSAVIGTHTHVQTADERILPQGTAMITDVGMVGPRNGILGMDRSRILRKMLTQMPERFAVAEGPCQFCAVLIDLHEQTGKAVAIERVFIYED
ncbi:TIGR00282 family metallophosphoesterase [Alicyclobacillus kakegawensis]|uniref:TIGR00282 family metallophosphoesterase n=1 Tax=Alicyclobacillus kakegawensis TaxID=392012 RepID=UPI00082D19F5|nr:TIGR00282 family metallophosphoesterase [Alicyclobacillus kakegawensis]